MTPREIIAALEAARDAAARYAREQGYPACAESIDRETAGIVGTLWAMEGARAWRAS